MPLGQPEASKEVRDEINRLRRREQELLDANNRYQQEAREARSLLKMAQEVREGIGASREKMFAVCREQRDELLHTVKQMTEECEVVRTALESRGYEDRGVLLSAVVLRALLDLDKAKQEIDEVRGVLRSTGHADTGRPMESLVDIAIDTERTHHEVTLDLLAKELGQEWAIWSGVDGRKDYAGYAAFLRERIRCDYTRNDAVMRMLGRIAQAVALPFVWKAGMPASDRVDDLVQHIAEMRKPNLQEAEWSAWKERVDTIANALDFPKWEFKSPDDQIEHLVSYIQKLLSLITPAAKKIVDEQFEEKGEPVVAYEPVDPRRGGMDDTFQPVKSLKEARRDHKRQFMWEGSAAPSADIDPSKIVPPIWNVLAERIADIEQFLGISKPRTRT